MIEKMARVLSGRPPMTSGMGLAVNTNDMFQLIHHNYNIGCGFKILPVLLSKHSTRADVAGTVNTFLGSSQLYLQLL